MGYIGNYILELKHTSPIIHHIGAYSCILINCASLISG